MTIKVVKLLTGEDVIADVQETNEGIILHRPAQILVTPQGLGLIEYPPLPVQRDMSLTLSNQHILAQFVPEVQLQNAYNDKFGSGVVVAPASAIDSLKSV